MDPFKEGLPITTKDVRFDVDKRVERNENYDVTMDVFGRSSFSWC
jgi:hypothetical protein